MSVIRPKYFFPSCTPAELLTVEAKIADVGQANPALGGLLSMTDVDLIPISANGPLGAGTLIEFIPNPLPNGHQSGFPKSGWAWHEFEGGGRTALIGYPEEAEIGPECFERAQMFEGAIVNDEVNRAWSIPIARAAENPFGNLPTRWVMTKEGLQTKVTKNATGIWEFGGEVLDYLRAINAWRCEGLPPPDAWKDPWAFDAALRLLGINYHLGAAELVLLDAMECGIMSVTFVATVLHAHTDFQAYLEYRLQKKTLEARDTIAALSNSNSGEQVA
jgi:hypothetical protein